MVATSQIKSLVSVYRAALAIALFVALLSVSGCSQAPKQTRSYTPPVIDDPSSSKKAAVAENTSSDQPATSPPATPQERFAQAVTFLQSGRLSEAEALLSTLVTEHPSRAAPLINLGITQARRRQWDAAKTSLTKALTLSGTSTQQKAAIQNQLGIVHRELKDYPAAEKAYQAALKLDSQQQNAQLNLAILYDLYLRQPQQAIAAYERYQTLLADNEHPMQAKTALWIERLKQNAQ